MKRVKNQSRNKRQIKALIPKKVQKDHQCQLEYSHEHSRQEFAVFICNVDHCDVTVVEHEDAPAGG